MPIENKNAFSTSKYVREAAQRRAVDVELLQFSQSESNRRTEAVLALRSTAPRFPTLAPGSVLDALSWEDYIKDTKMHLSILASSGEGIEQEIDFNSQKNFALLDDLQREALALDSYTVEEEMRTNGNYSQVHYNSFTRASDFALPYDSTEWISDYKTGLPFLKDNMNEVVANTGMTLPVRYEEEVSISSVTLVGEETSFGDTKTPLISNEPKNLLRKDRIFRHVIAERTHDETSRKYVNTPTNCTLLLELSGVQLMNMVCIRPVGQSTIYVEAISYINEANEEIALTSTELENETELIVLFEPIRTRYFKIKFRQYAPVEQANIKSVDFKAREINKLLRAADFNQLLTEESESIMGSVYDFSLETISCKLRTYENLGVFRSQPVAVRGPIACSFDDDTEVISVSNSQHEYGTTSFLAADEILMERYLGVDLVNREGSKALYDLVPIPDGKSSQKEFLAFFSGEAKVKLFPDYFSNIVNKYQFDEATWTNLDITIVFTKPHEIDPVLYPIGTPQTTPVIINAGPGSDAAPFNVRSTNWYVIDANTLVLRPESGAFTAITRTLDFSELNIEPYLYFESEQSANVNVYQEGTLLTFGTDYEISLDSGSNWYSDLSFVTKWSQISTSAKAGTFKVRLIAPDSTKIYYIDYKRLSNQQLSQSPGVNLKRGRIVFDRRYRRTSGTISPVIVSRADNVNPYLTPVMKSYFFKVRENVR